MQSVLVASAFFSAGAAIIAGYALWLLSARPKPKAKRDAFELEPVLIVVPVFDEAPLIAAKLANLYSLQYPAGLRQVVIVDGGSTDGTLEIISRWIPDHAGFDLLRTHHRNKTAQINAALRSYPSAGWILVTDADAVLPPQTIIELMSVAGPDTGVIGARVSPISAHAIESLHWRAADWLRGKECRRGSAAIVTAPCYLARRELIEEMPENTVADDIHVACRAMVSGSGVGLCESRVFELRSPRTFSMLLRHKYRKADAYLREVFRFLPSAARMPAPMRTIFLFRAALLTLLPLFWTIAGLVALSAAFDGAPYLAGAGAVVTLIVGAVAPRAARFVALASVLAGVSLLALVRYPISRQTASLPKILRPSEYLFPEDPL